VQRRRYLTEEEIFGSEDALAAFTLERELRVDGDDHGRQLGSGVGVGQAAAEGAAVQVDDVGGLREAEVQKRHQALAAGQDFGRVAVQRQQVQRLCQAGWVVVLEGGRFHVPGARWYTRDVASFKTVLPDRVDRHSVESLRAILDEFDIGGRLQHIRQFVWRGGTLQLCADCREAGQVLDVGYALTAEWPAAVLESELSTSANGLVAWQQPVLEGRWVQGSNGYTLRVGIDLSVASAIYIRSQRLLSHVPFMGRAASQVQEALNLELSAYVSAFLSRCQPVPQAAALDARRLHSLVRS
jgi:hypothetical protein